MYKSISELANGISEVQLELLLLLNSGYELVTNEGTHYKTWLEIENQHVEYRVRNATANILLHDKLIMDELEPIPFLFRYKISKQGKNVLEYNSTRKPRRLDEATYNIKAKGIEGVHYN